MCGILFKTNFYTKTDQVNFKIALDSIKHRGPDEEGILYTSLYSLGHRRLAIRDFTNGRQPMSKLNKHLIYNGELYNDKDLIKEFDLKIKGHGDTEVLFEGLDKVGTNFLPKLNGIFSFVYVNNDEIIAVRDQIGVKSIYYTLFNGDLIIASEIKALLNYGIEAVLGVEEAKELLSLSPQLTPGKTLYKGIYELPSGCYLKFNRKDGLQIIEYYKLDRKEFKMSYIDSVSYTNYLVKDAIKRQSVSDVGIASFLSGGLDSSIIAKTIADQKGKIDTFSIDYEGNKEEFIPNAYEISRDEDAILSLNKDNIFNHSTILIDTNTLFDYLKTTVILRDGPGMADIDSSLFFLAKEIAKNHKCATSGECADELFGGYPWFREKDINSFPWIKNIEFRESLLKQDVKEKLKIKEHIEKSFNDVKKNVPILPKDNKKRQQELLMNYLNIKYFMPTLLRRKDAITMGASLEVRVPFADRRLVEFAFNMPYKYKYRKNQEKAILRDAFEGVLPENILRRKKSPYPKSRSQLWGTKLKKELGEIIKTETPLIQLFDLNKIQELIDSDEELETPWFGQLMRKDALLAFIYQIHFWLNEYKIRVEI